MSTAVTVPLAEVQLLRQEIVVLRAQIAWLKQQLFGGGQSERLDRAQRLLQLDELEKPAPAAERPTATITYERAQGPGEKRTLPAESFAHLPVQETVVIEPAAVQADPTLYEKIGEERTFEVDLTPPKLFKREIVRPRYRHRLDRNRAPLLASAPARVVPGGFASAGLIAWALTAKYCDHLPLYRQEKMLARWGAPISRQNLCDWVGAATALLEALVKRMQTDLLQGGYVQVDETPVRCNDPDLKDGQTTQGWLWALSRPGGDVVFAWRLSRRHDEAEKLLGNYQGLLQSDGYEAYPAYVSAHPGVVWLGCWAHARRKFHDAMTEAPARAGFVLRLIAHLYQYEQAWRPAGPAARAALRQGHFGLTLALLKRSAQRLAELSLPRSQLGQACAYLLGHWAPLTAHLEHGRTQLDTNAVENAIRPSALGKKNWLFIGHPQAGDRAAVLYSLVVSCQRRRLDPFAYLKDVLTRLPRMTTKDNLAPLLPANWKPA
ncbi:MAG: IS66 family transposase, partial [Opitutaceae bacterium]|nr:IS66 family transposase [Opitutaceae bacterium]